MSGFVAVRSALVDFAAALGAVSSQALRPHFWDFASRRVCSLIGIHANGSDDAWVFRASRSSPIHAASFDSSCCALSVAMGIEWRFAARHSRGIRSGDRSAAMRRNRTTEQSHPPPHCPRTATNVACDTTAYMTSQ